jgi:hypothetical protein
MNTNQKKKKEKKKRNSLKSFTNSGGEVETMEREKGRTL